MYNYKIYLYYYILKLQIVGRKSKEKKKKKLFYNFRKKIFVNKNILNYTYLYRNSVLKQEFMSKNW